MQQTINTCPIYRMADGRAFTDYRPRCSQEAQMRDAAPSSYDARMYLMHNADQLMAYNVEQARKQSDCPSCYKPEQVGTMLNETAQVVCNAHTCKRTSTYPDGLGDGRVFNEGSAYPQLRHYPIGGLEEGPFGAAF